MDFFENAEKYAENTGIAEAIASAPAVICAFSGGADSSVLLRFLNRYLKKNGTPLVAAHMNHMIRGEDADADEDFCRKVCRELEIELFVSKKDIPAEAEKSGRGLEETARHLRYAFLLEISEKLGGALIATAHNATDNLETVIFNLARGSSVHGMGGISPVRENIIRPLLFATGDEIREFAKIKSIDYVTDKTNDDTDYTRNLIRHTVVPTLRRINPRADMAALRLSDSAREDDGYITGIAEEFINGREYIPRDEFCSLDDCIAKRVILFLCEKVNGRKNISEKNVSDAIALVKEGKIGSVSLSGLIFSAHKDAVFIKKADEACEVPAECRLVMNGFTEFGSFLVGIFNSDRRISPVDENIYNLFIHTVIDSGKIYDNLFVRTRREGDTYRVNGVSRKLKKLMCDEKIPQRIRSILPLICNEKEIVYVPMLKVADGYRGDGLHIIIYRKKEI